MLTKQWAHLQFWLNKIVSKTAGCGRSFTHRSPGPHSRQYAFHQHILQFYCQWPIKKTIIKKKVISSPPQSMAQREKQSVKDQVKVPLQGSCIMGTGLINIDFQPVTLTNGLGVLTDRRLPVRQSWKRRRCNMPSLTTGVAVAKMPPSLNIVKHWTSLTGSTWAIVHQIHCAVTVKREADMLLV